MDSNLLLYALVAVISAGMGMGVIALLGRLRKWDAEKEAAQILERAEASAQSRLKDAEIEAKEQAIKEKTRIEEQLGAQRDKLHERERQIDKRDDAVQLRESQLTKQEKMVESNQVRLAEKIQDADRRQKELDDLLDVERQTLHQLSSLGPEEAREQLLARLDKDLDHEQGIRIQDFERRIGERCEEIAREKLITTLQRFAAAHTAEATTSSVDIPNDDMKGRIIGREGRNIRSFEKATGVDVIIDDTPGVVIVSSFDPVRREVARLALAKLIADGRIHPSRIEELVAETEKEVEAEVQKFGEEAAREADVRGLHAKVIQLLGRLHYRTSYSQNVLRHSIEVAFVTGMLAEDLGMDGKLARRAGLLHDIGKAADHDAEGGHPKIGADPAETLRRERHRRPRGSRSPRRLAARPAVHGALRGGRRLQRLASRRPSRDARPLHQADARTRGDRHRLRRRPPGLRHPGGPRGARHRPDRQDDRRVGREDLSRHRQIVRRAADLPGRDPRYDDPRDPRLTNREVRRCAFSSSATSSASPDGKSSSGRCPV